MVASRLVDHPEDILDGNEVNLPPMMFADGEEPVGVRVLTYQFSRSINTILNALNKDEIRYESHLSVNSFARYLLSRQLKVGKKHEAWFLFAGKPIRFSLREFAIVTGLPCGELPKIQKLKKKKNINEKPYWPELFGSMEEMRVSRAVKMRRKKTVTDPDIRIKLVCLAIVSSELLSTNLKMKMLKEDEISLSQNTIALKGFALALQLVIVETYPVRKTMKKTLNPAHAREVDRKAEVKVSSIIPEDPQRPVNESVLGWTDEVLDIKVDNLVNLIYQNFVFAKDMFKGGATKSDVEKMREESKNVGKKKQTRENERQSVVADDGKLASMVLALMKPEIKRIDGNVSAGIASMKKLASSSVQYKDDVIATVSVMINEMKSDILRSLAAGNTDAASQGHDISISTGNVSKTGFTKQPSGQCEGGNGDVASEGHHISPSTGNVSKPGSSKQPTVLGEDENANTIEDVLVNLSHYSTPPGSPNEVLKITLPPVSFPLTTNNRVTSASRESGPVDYSRHEMSPHSGHSETRIRRRSDIEQPSFSLGMTQDKVASPPLQDDDMGENETELGEATHHDAQISRKSKRMRIVPPYLLTGYQCGSAILNRLCLDFNASKLYVFDCNAGLTAEFAICKELLPISEMFPLLLKQCGVSVPGVDTPLIVERIQGVAQNQNPADSAITTALLIQTHSLFGTDPCLAITPSVIADEAHRAAVMVYEFHAKL
ncbi:hypothetical protein Bca52824_016577 [Brassica carinata]|uniref:DUF1985 domain-containing protein n=1 Tax=Brassica carinata TaxID=52824 RepID=A0A8X8B477_BRACI|nr:hypothetical protein Bca52824_016577 [Brassica carinata]